MPRSKKTCILTKKLVSVEKETVVPVEKETVATTKKKVIQKKPKKKKKNRKDKIKNYMEAKCIDDIKRSFKTKELKDILKENNCKISGSKTDLVNRIWEIVNKKMDDKGAETESVSLTPESEIKLEIKNNHEIKHSESEEEEDVVKVGLDPDNLPSIYIVNGLKDESNTSPENEFKMLENKNNKFYIFKEGEDEFEFKGELIDNKLVELDECPKSLIEMLGLD